jgi:hypothetical protein
MPYVMLEKKQEKVKLAVKIQQHLGDNPSCTMAQLQEVVGAKRQRIVDELKLMEQRQCE